MTYTVFLPALLAALLPWPIKGTAGTYGDMRSGQVGQWGYNWYRASYGRWSGDYEIAGMVQFRSTPPGSVIVSDSLHELVGNEPNESSQDNMAPPEFAAAFKQVSAQLPGKRLIVGNVTDLTWLSAFDSECACRNLIAGYGVHNYRVGPDFVAFLDDAVAWREGHDPTKELWLSEFSHDDMAWACAQIKARPFARYAVYVGVYPSWDTAQAPLSLFDTEGGLTQRGIIYRDNC